MANAYQEMVQSNWNRAVPMSALLELTFVCNHACSFCYNSPTGQKEMTTEEVKDALRKLAEMNILYLTLSGGEPLVRKDFFEIARTARELGFALRIYTNAFLIDEAMARRIKEVANPLEMEIDDFLEKYWTSDEYSHVRGDQVPQPRHDEPGEAACGTGRSALAIDPYGNIYPCVQWRRKAGNIKELKSLKEMWHTSPVLIEVRKTAVEIAQRVLKDAKN